MYPSSPPPPLSNEKASAAKGEAMKRPPKRQAERRDGGKRHFGVGAVSLCGRKEEVTFVALARFDGDRSDFPGGP